MFIDLYYHKDTTLLPALGRSLWSLQLILGSPKLTISIGKYSQQMLKIMESMRQCLGSSNIENEIGALIIMDRNYDLITPLLTPVTYAGLLHEVVEINVGTGILGKSQTKLDPDKDQIYGEVRDTPCSEVFPILHGKAKLLKCIFVYLYIFLNISILIISNILMIYISGTKCHTNDKII